MPSHPPFDAGSSTDRPSSAAALPRVVCGTNFSEAAAKAVDVAAMFAMHRREPLVLVHALNEEAQQNLPNPLRDSLSLYAQAQLHEERERIRAVHAAVTEVVRVGVPDRVLLDEASPNGSMLVLGATRRRTTPWIVGGVAERTAEAGCAPTLVIRDAEPLLRWARCERHLRVFIGMDLDPASEAALDWVNALRQLGPCDIAVAYAEPSRTGRRGTPSPGSSIAHEMAHAASRMEERCFRQRIRALLGRSRVRVRFEREWAGSDAHLIKQAVAERADLIVIGAQSGSDWPQPGRHSVSRGVLHYAPVNVACVPARRDVTGRPPVPAASY